MIPLLAFQEPGDVVVNLDQLVRSRMLVQANSGGGKSRALRYTLEQTHGQLQHIIIDPEGEFATLRERFPYVLAGRDGDVPADPRSAKLLCRRLMELGASAVLDIYDLSLPDRRKFVRLFLEELMHLPRTLWRPLLVVIDEAHVFCPERGSGEAESTEAVITLCTQGRKRGFAPVLATQRISKLHKDAAAELLNKLVGRTGLDVDVKRAGDDLGFDKEQRQALKALRPGTFYAYGPAISPTVTLVRTGDVVTSHPEPGQAAPPAPPAPAAVQAMLGELRDLPQQAEEEARSVEALQRQVRDLNAQLRRAERSGAERVVERPVIDQAAIDRAVANVQRKAEEQLRQRLQGAAALARRLRTTHGALAAGVAELERLAEALAETPEPAGPTSTPAPPPVRRDRDPRPAPVPAVAPVPSVASSTGAVTSGLSRTQQRLLNALAFYADLGQDVSSRAAVAGIVGVTHTSGSFSNNLSALRVAGLIEDHAGGLVSLTAAGQAAVTERPQVSSLADLHALWLSHRALSGTQQRMLRELIAAHPDAITRTALADAIGVQATSGSYSNNLSRLRTMGLMVDVSRTDVIAAELLFPAGLP